MKNIKKLVLGLLLTLGLSACTNVSPVVNNNANNKKVESVTLDVSGEVIMEKDQTLTVTPTITYQGGEAVEVDQVWTSSRPKVASVAAGENGATVTAHSAGSSKISFIAGVKMAYFTVTIYGQNNGGGNTGGGDDTPTTPVDPKVASISLNTYSRTLSVDETFQIVVSLVNPDGLDETVAYASEDANVAIVDSTGLVQGKAAGKTNIVVTALGKTAKCEVTVKAESEPEEEEDFDFTVFFFVDYNNIDENDETGTKLLAKFGWYHNEPIANSGKVPAAPTQALDPAFPYFVGWSTHTIIDTKADLCDLSTYVVENAHFLFIYGIWSDVPAGSFTL